MDDLNTLWSKLLSDYARIKNKSTKLSGGYQAFIDAAAALIRQCYGALSSLTDNEYTVDGGTPFIQIDVITELVTESGPIVSFDTKLHSSRPIEALIVDIDPIQSGTGEPSPTNIRPISGRNSVSVNVSPTTDTEDGTIYNISLSSANTVYGGTRDVISGAQTVGFRAFVLSSDGVGSYSFNSANGQLCITGLLSMLNTLDNICSHYKSFSGSFANLPDKSFMASSSTIAIKDSDYTSLESWKTYLDAQLSANTPVQVCVKLSEAQTIQLTPQEIKTLIGNNNIWADAGDVTVTYPAKSDKDCNGGYPGS